MNTGKAIFITYKENKTDVLENIETSNNLVDLIVNLSILYNTDLSDQIDHTIFCNTIEDTNDYEIENVLLFLSDEISDALITELNNQKNIEIIEYKDVTNLILNENSNLISEFKITKDSLLDYKKENLGIDGILDKINESGKGSLTEIDIEILQTM